MRSHDCTALPLLLLPAEMLATLLYSMQSSCSEITSSQADRDWFSIVKQANRRREVLATKLGALQYPSLDWGSQSYW